MRSVRLDPAWTPDGQISRSLVRPPRRYNGCPLVVLGVCHRVRRTALSRERPQLGAPQRSLAAGYPSLDAVARTIAGTAAEGFAHEHARTKPDRTLPRLFVPMWSKGRPARRPTTRYRRAKRRASAPKLSRFPEGLLDTGSVASDAPPGCTKET